MSAVIYINGVRRNASHIGTCFTVDSDCLPMRPCAEHKLTPGAIVHLRSGGRVYTSGNWYSLSQPGPGESQEPPK